MKTQSLLSQREHLKSASEADRKKLSDMWDKGQQNTWLFKKIAQRRELTEAKIDRINNKLCPWY
jgi:hypothetical protein